MNSCLKSVLKRFDALDRALDSRSESDSLRLLHCYAQMRRALRSRQSPISFEAWNSSIEHELRYRNYDVVEHFLTEALKVFPWQNARHRSWLSSGRLKWRRFSSDVHFVTFDPSASGADDKNQRLVPYDWRREPKIMIFPGNRAHLDCLEWQDPNYIDLHTFDYAEAYTFRYMRSLANLVPDTVRSKYKVVGVVFGACRDRHENRLEHFNVYHEPGWIPPRCERLAQTLSKLWLSDLESCREDGCGIGIPIITIGFSMGCTIMESVLRLTEGFLKNNEAEYCRARKALDESVAIQLGGYMSSNLSSSMVRRLVFTSFLDENVVGSYNGLFDLKHVANDKGLSFTSPIRVPENPWKHLSMYDRELLARGDFVSIPSRPLVSLAEGCQIGQFAGPPAVSTITGQSDSTAMAITRFGHLIDPQVVAVVQHYGDVLEKLFEHAQRS